MNDGKLRVCPVERTGSLDNILRKWFQNPNKILAPFIKEGMKVLDVGCGPGFFSIEIAKMVGKSGKVFSVDLQEGMLQKLRNKINRTSLEEIIKPIKCEVNDLNMHDKVDFILAFYMVHEVPDKDKLFHSLKNILNSNGTLLIVEPKFGHVTKPEFDITINKAEKIGFIASPAPKLAFSFSSLLNIT